MGATATVVGTGVEVVEVVELWLVGVSAGEEAGAVVVDVEVVDVEVVDVVVVDVVVVVVNRVIERTGSGASGSRSSTAFTRPAVVAEASTKARNKNRRRRMTLRILVGEEVAQMSPR